MHVTQLEWIITLGVTIAILLFDVIVIGRRPHEPSKRETGTYLTIYLSLAVAFGIWCGTPSTALSSGRSMLPVGRSWRRVWCWPRQPGSSACL